MRFISRIILEQVKQFNYLGCELSLDSVPDFDKKINIFHGFLSFRRVVNVIYSFLGNSPASEI